MELRTLDLVSAITISVLVLGPLAFGQIRSHIEWTAWVQTVATVASVGVAVALFRVTRRQADISERLAEIAHRQADISEQGLTVAKQPQVFVAKVDFTSMNAGTVVATPAATYTIDIVGETPAIIRSLSESIVYMEQPSPVNAGYGFQVDITKTAGQSQNRQVPFHAMTEDIRREIRIQNQSVPPKYFFLTCAIVYDDVFGNQTEFGFCYKGFRGGGPGTLYGGPEYNYRLRRRFDQRI